MKLSLSSLVVVTVLPLFLCPLAAEAQIARQMSKIDMEIAADRAVTWTSRREVVVLSPAAIHAVSTILHPVLGGDKVELIEAVTRKSDGRVIPVDRSEIATQDGAISAAMSFVDLKIMKIPFREVAVGDTLLLEIMTVRREHYVPGHYSHREIYAPTGFELTLDFTLRTPTALLLRHHARGFQLAESREGDQVIRNWSGVTFEKQTAETNIANLDQILPSLAFTTFESYEAIGAAYAASATPKMAVSPAVQKVADEITVGISDAETQARAIFRWVSTNVRYVAVYIGAGRIVPNEVDLILTRRFGDCKDHVALMSALLAAKGIASQPALINTNNFFELPEVPLLQAFNHVILYLPQFGRYVDPTVPTSSFDGLPTPALGKPVVVMGPTGSRVARTAIAPTATNFARIDTRLSLAASGDLAAETRAEGRGEFASWLREVVAQAETKGMDVATNTIAKARDMIGSATITAPQSTDQSDPYAISFTWRGDRPANLAKGWRPPDGFTPIVGGAGGFFWGVYSGRRSHSAQCRPGQIEQTVSIDLPDGVTPLKLPNQIIFENSDYRYSRTWFEEGRTLVVRTIATSMVESRVCSAEQVNRLMDWIEQRRNDFRPTIQFRGAAP